MARKPTVTMSSDASLTDLGYVKGKGAVEIGGSFDGGTLTLFCSLSDGTVKNAMRDGTGTAYSTVSGDTFPFDFTFLDNQDISAKLYATLSGSTSPSVTLLVIDQA